MAARRCSYCSIDFPAEMGRHAICDACGEKTAYFSNLDPDPDWEYSVGLRRATIADREDTFLMWRTEKLYKAGLPYDSALEVARNREVDIHKAVEMLEQGCDPFLAVEILI